MSIMMSEYRPDNFIIVRIDDEHNGLYYKVLAGWSGGYTTGDSWRMNSGIESYHIDDDGYIHFKGYSGSVYICHKDSEAIRMNIAGVLGKLLNDYPDIASHISFEDFMNEFDTK